MGTGAPDVFLHRSLMVHWYRPHPKGLRKLCFHRCLSVQLSNFGGGGAGYPPSFPTWGRVPHPSQLGRYPILPEGGGVPAFQIWTGGIPFQVRMGGTPLSRSEKRVPPTLTWEGDTPCPDQGPGCRGTPNRNSIECTCYTAGGMTLTFIQEDFLVLLNYFNVIFRWQVHHVVLHSSR